MPTAAKTIAAFCLAFLGFVASELVKSLQPEILYWGNFTLYNAALGALVGWIVIGRRAGRGTKDAIGNGITGVAAFVFWALFLHSAYEMFQLSLKRRFGDPVEAFAAIFEIGLEFGAILLNPMMIALLVIGALVSGYASEYAARHWR